MGRGGPVQSELSGTGFLIEMSWDSPICMDSRKMDLLAREDMMQREGRVLMRTFKKYTLIKLHLKRSNGLKFYLSFLGRRFAWFCLWE